MLRTCPTCTALIVGRDGSPPKDCPFCKGPIEHTWEGGMRRVLMTSAMLLGATALAHPWTNVLLPTESLPAFHLTTAPRPAEVLLLQAMSWFFLVISARVLTRTGKVQQAASWMLLAVLGWGGALLLTIPPGMIPYELMATPSQLGGVLGSMLHLSTAALLFLATLGELLLGHLAFTTVN